MYDEYRISAETRLMCRRIYDQVAQEEENPRMAEGSDSGDGISGIMQQAKRIQEFQKKNSTNERKGPDLGIKGSDSFWICRRVDKKVLVC